MIPFGTAVSAARSALLIMPFNPGQFLPTVTVISTLRERFGDQNITVITGGRGMEVAHMLPRGKFIHVLKTDLNLLFLPSRYILKQITERPYDLAIDLNLDLVVPSGYICRASGARVRVGFVSRYADAFYNFQVKPDTTLGQKLIYDRLANSLKMFLAGG
jgi:ADP-heptose:LPS heptosyltransferase